MLRGDAKIRRIDSKAYHNVKKGGESLLFSLEKAVF